MVVFPTPPFWFATTKIRGSAGEGKRNSPPVSREEHRLPARGLGRSESSSSRNGPAWDQADEDVDLAVLPGGALGMASLETRVGQSIVSRETLGQPIRSSICTACRPAEGRCDFDFGHQTGADLD